MRRKRTHQQVGGSKQSNPSQIISDEQQQQQIELKQNQNKKVIIDDEQERQIQIQKKVQGNSDSDKQQSQQKAGYLIGENKDFEKDDDDLDEDDDDDENFDKIEKDDKNKKINTYDPKNITPKDMVFINYYRWTFLFFFFHFFSFICATDMVNEFGLYNNDDNNFDKQFPKILPVLYVYLVFCVMILLYMFIAYKITYQRTMKQFYIIMTIFICLYFIKLLFLILLISVEPDMNLMFSQYYKDITDDNQTDLCSEDDYSICRMTLSWNFFKYQLIFDSIAVTIIFGVYIYFIRKYKIQLIKDLVENIEYQNLARIPGLKSQNSTQQRGKCSINPHDDLSISQQNQSELIINQ